MLLGMHDFLRQLWKTILRWTSFPVHSYQYARGYGQGRAEAIRFAVNMAASSQWANWTWWGPG
jgi:hypothetical protein